MACPWALASLLVASLLAACGGDPEAPNTGDPYANGARGGTAGTDSGGTSNRGGTGGVINIGGGNACVPHTCESLGTSCGTVADGCGEILNCGECEADGLCGLLSPNVCATPDDLSTLCQPLSKKEACANKQCGIEGDGCGNVYECGDCPQGEACGLDEAFQCAPAITDPTENCPARIESCEAADVECGVIGNGCGGIIDCDAEKGGCAAGQGCGVAEPGKCGELPTCEPFTAAEACAGKCGLVSNGCGNDVDGGLIDCSAMFPCPNGQTCGGGGVPNQCGTSANSCQPVAKTQACEGIECGAVGDGCTGSYSCGTCSGGALCVQGQCEQPSCSAIPRATACAGKACGAVGDGCGGTYNCGTCGANQQCGLRTAFQCGTVTPTSCTPLTKQQACAGKECGTVYDGCGSAPANQINCGTCTTGQFCGLRQAFQCDAPQVPTCTPNATSCAALGWECGMAVNSCGTVYDCATEGRSCGPLETCVGGITGPARCETPAGLNCPLCAAVADCSGRPQRTRLAGRVVTPGRANNDTGNQVGVPNAYVYILRTNNVADLPAVGSGIPAGGESCDRCNDQDLGAVLASSVTSATGEFVIEGNVPVGQQFLLVVKVGKFRRAVQYTLPASAACTTTNLPTAVATNPTRLPRTMSDGLAVNIPRIAITTGQIDAMECVFEKMGIASTEFTNGSATTSGPRVHLYRGGSSSTPRGASLNASTPHDTALYSDAARMRSYDMVVADCEGQTWDSSFSQRDSYGGNVRDYVNRGGRLFASHLSFSWLHENGTAAYATGSARFATGLGPAATWDPALYTDTSGLGRVAIGRPRASSRIQNFADWMINQGVIANSTATFTITDPRSNATGLGPASEEFVYRTNGNQRTQQFSFNTPYSAPQAAACGRVAYSGFHVASTGGSTTPFATVTFPDHCSGSLTGQEKVLLYMLFDLGACVGDEPNPPACSPQACPAYPSCGTRPDGCGDTLNCGCNSGESCINGQCTKQGCVPTTCAAEGIICSTISNGCGQALQCPCDVCTPKTKQQACNGVTCGYASDGCSGVYLCSECPPSCKPLTACPPDKNCGVISDGCSGTLNCGTCTAGKVCGGAGVPNRCDVPQCKPLTCRDLNASCGLIGDGCGSSVNCGACTAGQVCRTANGEQRCDGCMPRTCESVAAECGLIGDGCGGTVDCGSCPAEQTCGANEPNRCGDGRKCVPLTCEAAGAACGVIGDGCGGRLDCGTCPPGQICGLEKPFQCAAPPPCTPSTCEELGAECGFVADGCSDLLDCGECAEGFTCGLGQANECARIR
ncbi:MAG TPA: hypothetical protein VFQ61_19920 [Polyangiaceae bacterium]|nr:hypothetical protein [Polyangiaceae bacterium]